jgi:hypothetical protein
MKIIIKQETGNNIDRSDFTSTVKPALKAISIEQNTI